MVLLGDPGLPDKVKNGGRFNPEDVDAVARLRAALSSIEDYSFYYVENHSELIDRLRSDRPALVFNLCDEGFNNDPEMELHVPALLDMLAIKYTGAPPSCLAVCYDKSLVRALALSMNIPVPDELRVTRGAREAATLPFPLFVKPARADGSFGIRAQSYVETEAELRDALDWLEGFDAGGPCLVQEFLPGAEYSLGIVGNVDADLEVLPVIEVDYAASARRAAHSMLRVRSGIPLLDEYPPPEGRCCLIANCARCSARRSTCFARWDAATMRASTFERMREARSSCSRSIPTPAGAATARWRSWRSSRGSATASCCRRYWIARGSVRNKRTL